VSNLGQVWQSKSDAQVRAAIENLKDYSLDAQAAIRAEFERRQMESGLTEEEEVVAKENREHPDLASRGDRLSAQTVDWLIVMSPFLIVFALFKVSELLGTINEVIAYVFMLWYALFSDSFRGGQSWGKRVVNIDVVDQVTRKPCRRWQSVARNAPSLFLGPIDWLPIFGKRRLRLGDLMAGTIVIKK
jgi:uncharacterized RDD family membrane protein YckC